jgi:hypothetical protein
MNYIRAIKRIAYELGRETHKDLSYGIPKDYLKGYLNGYVGRHLGAYLAYGISKGYLRNYIKAT